ncbi:MAG TPA: hypothetical protein VFS95_11725 [Telluria sp.]|nr:hypothetical protein [Telluria sp.]
MHLIRPAIDALEETLEPFFQTDGWQYDQKYFEAVPALYRRTQPIALGGGEVVLVVMGFLGTCFAKKIFDEVYERTLKRPIGAQLDRLFKKVEVPVGKVIEYRDVIYFEDIDLVVVIRAIATKEATVDLQSQVMLAHRVAHSYIEQHGRQAPIHCHTILDGQIAIEPELFLTLESIKQHDRSQLKITNRN